MGFEGNTSFLAKSLVNCPCCHLVVTSKFEYYCVSRFSHRVHFKSYSVSYPPCTRGAGKEELLC